MKLPRLTIGFIAIGVSLLAATLWVRSMWWCEPDPFPEPTEG